MVMIKIKKDENDTNSNNIPNKNEIKLRHE